MNKLIILLLTGCVNQGNPMPEQMQAVYSKNGQVLKSEIVATGNHNSVSVNALSLVAHCTLLHCDHITLAHTHPGSYYAHASQVDMDNAYKFKELMKQANITTEFVVIAEKDCERVAWEDAGQALSNTIYAMNRSTEYAILKNNSDISGMHTGSLIDYDWHWPDTGNTSGKNSGTNYKGLSSRQAYDKALHECHKL